MRPGLPARQTHDYQRKGLTSLYAALEVATGRVLGECTPRHTGADFLRFLRRLRRAYRGRELHIVLDKSSTHTTPAVQAWLAAHPEIHFHFTPKGASWLNMVEAWLSYSHPQVSPPGIVPISARGRRSDGLVGDAAERGVRSHRRR